MLNFIVWSGSERSEEVQVTRGRDHVVKVAPSGKVWHFCFFPSLVLLYFSPIFKGKEFLTT